MEAQLFTLVSEGDPTQIFAWGMEINSGDDMEAIVYRRDPLTQRTMFGIHNSAEDALARYSRTHPLDLHWEHQS